MATLVGMALGGWMSGAIFDLTGSYTAAFLNGLAWNLVNVVDRGVAAAAAAAAASRRRPDSHMPGEAVHRVVSRPGMRARIAAELAGNAATRSNGVLAQSGCTRQLKTIASSV